MIAPDVKLGKDVAIRHPDLVARVGRELQELFADSGVGGCCGTTPAHIRMAARAVKSMSGVKQYVAIVSSPAPVSKDGHGSSPMPTAVPFPEKSVFAAKLAAGRRAKADVL